MGHWGAVLHITGLLPLQSKRFQQSAAAAIWEDGGKNLPPLAGGGVFSQLSTWPLVDRLHFSASKRKINLLQIVPACHRYNPVPKSLINWGFDSKSCRSSTGASVAFSASHNTKSVGYGVIRAKGLWTLWRSREQLQRAISVLEVKKHTCRQIRGCAQLTGQIGSR